MSDTAWVSPWERAMALYRGPFLVEEDGAGWAKLRRERLHNRVVEVGQRLIDHWSRTGDAIKAQGVRRWIHAVTLESFDVRSPR
ncbi:bacterial transcriptional activator domain-containing protein [Nitrospira moscoviensis]